MDDTMDYVFHHREQHPNHAQLPYNTQPPRCPYFNRTETYGHTTSVPPHRPHYDPVHASANNWQSQSHLPPHHWQPAMLGHATSSPYHRPAGSAPEPPYYNPMPSLRMGPNWQNPVHGVGGLRALQSPYSTQQLPPVHYGPVPTNPPSRHQPQMPGSESAFGQSSVSTNNNHLGTYTPPVTSTPPAPVQDSPQSGVESPSVPEPPASEFTAAPAQAPLTSTNIQFGSAPPSSDGPFLYRSYRPTAGGGFSGSSTSLNNPVPAAPPAERRRVVATPLRRLSRRTPPPSDRDYDEVEFRMLEHAMGSVGRDIDDNHIRNAQMMRGSVTTKMVASISAIQSLQSVDVSDLSESERSCIICYNDFGVETPEGVKEAPLRLPKCKHIFGDHCIKKWFEDSDSCPYCRDKLPSEPKMTSTNTHLANLLFRQRALREREVNHGSDESGRATAGERRSPPTDGGESRRRIRPRHGPGRGPGSPPFSVIRPGSFGGSSTNHERRSHNFNAIRTHVANAPARGHGGGPSSVPFSTGHLTQYHTPSFGGPPDIASSSAPMVPPSYVPPPMPYGVPPSGQGAGFPSSANRNSLPAPPPGNWQSGISEDTHRRMMLGENSSNPLAGGTTHWGGQ